MFARSEGEPGAPLLLFLHGGGLAGWMWDAQVEQFGQQFSLLVPDLPGHGRSSGPFTTIQDAADSVAELIAEHESSRLGLPATVIGFSLGAQVAVALQAGHDGLAARSVIISALAEPAGLATKLLLPLLGWTLPLARRRWFAKLQARQSFITEANFEQYFATSSALGRETFLNMMRENQAFDIPAGWSRNDARTLVLAGEKELPAVRRSAAKLADAAPNAELLIAQGFGHGVPLQDGKWVQRTAG